MIIELAIEEKDAELIVKSKSKKHKHVKKFFPEGNETEIRIGCCYI